MAADAELAPIGSVRVLHCVSTTRRDDGRVVDTETADIVDESEDDEDAEVRLFFGSGCGGGTVTTAGGCWCSGLRLVPDPARRPTRSRPRSPKRLTPSLSRSPRPPA